MEYSIKILQEDLDILNASYEKFVIKGTVKTNSVVALENRKKALDLSKAISILTTSQP